MRSHINYNLNYRKENMKNNKHYFKENIKETMEINLGGFQYLDDKWYRTGVKFSILGDLSTQVGITTNISLYGTYVLKHFEYLPTFHLPMWSSY